MALLKRESPIQAFTGETRDLHCGDTRHGVSSSVAACSRSPGDLEKHFVPEKNRSTTNDIFKPKISHNDIEAERRVFELNFSALMICLDDWDMLRFQNPGASRSCIVQWAKFRWQLDDHIQYHNLHRSKLHRCRSLCNSHRSWYRNQHHKWLLHLEGTNSHRGDFIFF